MYRINNEIHFIWAGGKTIPDKQLSVIKQWHALNSEHYKVTLWVDKATTPPAEMAELSEILNKMSSTGIQVKDITEEKVNSDSVRNELDKPKPNYGLSSDMLRLSILAKFGGIYLDCDILPNKPLPPIIEAKHGILFSPWSQGGIDISNDIIMCTAGNEIMQKLADLTQESYKNRFGLSSILGSWTNASDLLYWSNDFTIYADKGRNAIYTMCTTGPVFLRKLLVEMGLYTGKNDHETNEFISYGENIDAFNLEYVFSGELNVPEFIDQNTKNDSSWNKADFRPNYLNKNYAEKLNLILKHIEFDIHTQGWLLLSSYVYQLKKMHPEYEEEKIANDICEKLLLDGKLLEKVTKIQVVPYIATANGKEIWRVVQGQLKNQSLQPHIKAFFEQKPPKDIDFIRGSIISMFGDGSYYAAKNYPLELLLSECCKYDESTLQRKMLIEGFIDQANHEILKSMINYFKQESSYRPRPFDTEYFINFRKHKSSLCSELLKRCLERLVALEAKASQTPDSPSAKK
jgi:hypothetical protein